MISAIRVVLFLCLILWAAFPAQAIFKLCPPLRKCTDTPLQRELEARMDRMGLREAIREKALSVALVDITDSRHPKLAQINGDEMMYAASLPKIAILLGAFERVSRGEMRLDAETRECLTRMIRNSSNDAATEMMNRVGKQFILDLLKSPKYRLYTPEFNGGLWVGKEYGKSPAWKRDPLHNLSHGATAFQTARFYYLMENGMLVTPGLCREMKKMMGRPAISHKFVNGLMKTHPDARIYRKSGTWKNFHSDSAIVERNGRRYIAVALAHNPEGGQWLSDLIVALDDTIMSSGMNSDRVF